MKKEAQRMPRCDFEGFSNIRDPPGSEDTLCRSQWSSGVQRVLSEHGITKALLGTRSGAALQRKKKAMEGHGALLPIFVAPEQLEPHISKDLMDGPLSPIDYMDGDRKSVRG